MVYDSQFDLKPINRNIYYGWFVVLGCASVEFGVE